MIWLLFAALFLAGWFFTDPDGFKATFKGIAQFVFFATLLLAFFFVIFALAA